MTLVRPLCRLSALAALTLVGCLPATNAYDPNTPAELQARGSIGGGLQLVYSAPTTSIVEARLNGLAVVLTNVGSGDDETAAIRATCAEALTCDAEAGTATFNFADLVPGTYRLGVEDPPAGLTDPTGGRSLVIELAAGESYVEPTLVFTEPVINDDDEGQGIINGRVVVDSGAANPTVTAYQLVGTSAVARRETSTLPDGTFRLDGLPAGDYAVAAQADGFTPDFSTSISVVDDEVTLEDDLVLFAGTAVINPDVQQVFGATYTSDDSVPVQVLAFGGMTEMRVWSGETPPADFVEYSAASAIDLPDVQGAITLSAQFRLTTADGVVFTTEVFTGEVVRDTAPPDVIDAFVVGKDLAADGVIYSTSAGETISVEVAVNDVTSATYSVDVVEGPADMAPLADAFAFENTFLPLGYVQAQQTVGLSSGEGEKALWVGVRDRAENVAVSGPIFITVDTEAPQLGDTGAGVAPIEVVEAAAGALSSHTATVRVNLDPSTTGIASVVVGQKPLANNAPASTYGPGDTYDSDTTVSVDGDHGDMVAFVARVTDFAGNTEEVETLELLLNFTGTVAGRALLDEEPAGSLVHAGTSVSLWAAGKDPDADAADHVVMTDDTGAFAIPDVIEGANYRVRYERPGADTVDNLVGEVIAGETVTLPTVLLPVSRGNIAGVFQRQDVADPTGHGGILVEALFGGVVYAITVTEDDGAYRFPFPGLPVTVGTDRYTVRASDDGYLPLTQTAIQVSADTDTVVDPDGNGDPQPGLLLPETGDFTLCAATGPCDPVQYTADETLRIGLPGDDSDVTDVRYQARTEFLEGDADPAWAGSYTPGGDLLVDISGADGVVEVFLQLERAGVQGPVLRATVILDNVPPTVNDVLIADGPTASLAGFTNLSTLDVTVLADAGGTNTAPVQQHYVVIADLQPGALPMDATSCALGGCDIDLPDTGGVVDEQLWTLWGYSCDAAGNCSTAGVASSVVYDRTDPTALNGAAFAPVGDNLNTVNMVTYTGARDFLIDLALGAARTGADDEVLDTDGLPVADVTAYRFKSVYAGAGMPPTAVSFTGVPWVSVDDPAAGGAVDGIASPSLLGGQGVYRLFAQLRDGAGNVSELDPADFTADVTLDTVDPGAQFEVVAPGGYTTSPIVTVRVVSSASDPVVEVQVALDDGLFETVQTEPIDDLDDTFTLDLNDLLPLQGADGAYEINARVIDAAGNSVVKDATVTLDTVAPVPAAFVCSNCAEAGGDLYVGALEVLFDVEANDAIGDVASVVLSIDGVAQTPDGYDGTTTAQLGAMAAGAYTFTVSFVDEAGNASDPADAPTLVINYDDAITDPVLVINNGDAWATNALGQVTLSISSPDTDLVEMRLGNEGNFGGWQAYVDNIGWTLAQPAVEGMKTVDVQVRDAAGNVAADAASISLDLAPPTGTVSIDQAPYAIETAITLDLTHPTDVDEIAIVASPTVDCDTQTYDDMTVTLATTTTLDVAATLNAPDGLKYVTVCFRDQAGQTYGATAETTLDRAPPTGSVSIENGAATTTSSMVSVYLTAPEDIADVVLGTTSLDCNDGGLVWEGYDAVKSTTLPIIDDDNTVKVCFRDAAGHVTAASDTIYYDFSDPGGTVDIEGAGVLTTTSRDVTLYLDAAEDTVLYAATDGTGLDCANATYSAYAQQVPWTLPDTDGPVSVTVCFEDAAGQQSSATDSIDLDITPPAGTIEIESGADYTRSSSVTVDLTHPTDTEGYTIAEGLLDCATVSSGLFVATMPGSSSTSGVGATLSAGDGTKTLSVCFIDDAGLRAGSSDGIQLDGTPPAGSVTINDDDFATSSDSVTLSYDAAADVEEYVVAFDGTVLDCNQDPPAAGFPYDTFNVSSENVTLPAPDGLKTVTACFRDEAGNPISAGDDIWLDQDAPEVTLVEINNDDTYTTGTGVQLYVEVTDDPLVTPAIEMQVSESPDFAGAAWVAIDDEVTHTLTSNNGPKRVFVRVRDGAGNVSPTSLGPGYGPDSDTIILDTVGPVILGANVASQYLTAPPVQVQLFLNDNLDGPLDLDLSFATASANACDGPFEDWSAAGHAVTIPDVEGAVEVYACARDLAGNETTSGGLAITIDKSDPPGVPDPTIIGGSRQFSASWAGLPDNGPAGMDHYRVDVYSDIAQSNLVATVETSTNSVDVTALKNAIEYWVRITAVDRAGNEGAPSPPTPVVVGVKGAVTPFTIPVAGPDFTNPTVIYAQGRIWAALNNSLSGLVSLVSCDIEQSDCRHPDNWTHGQLNTGGAGTAVVGRRVPMVHFDSRLWAAMVVEDGGQNKIVLSRCNDFLDCADGSAWTSFDAAGPAPGIDDDAVALTAGGTVVALGYTDNDELHVATCSPNDNDCNELADFGGAVPVTPTVAGEDPMISLAASERLVASIFRSQDDRVSIAVCDLTVSFCKGPADWNAYLVRNPGTDGPAAAYSLPDITIAGDYAYASWRMQDGNSWELRTSRCPVGSQCPAADDWTEGARFFTPDGPFDQPHLGAGLSSLYATWWDGALGAVRLAVCDDPNGAAGGCTVQSNWRVMVGDPVVNLETEPHVTAAGPSPIVAYMSGLQIKMLLPAVPPPLDHVVVAGAGNAKQSWSAQFDHDGYEQLFGGGPPNWVNVFDLGDASLANDTLGLPPGQHPVSIRTVNDDGQISDDAVIFDVEAHQVGNPNLAEVYTNAYRCPPGIGQTCAVVGAHGNEDMLLMAYAGPSGPTGGDEAYVVGCNAVFSDCSIDSSWVNVRLTAAEFGTNQRFDTVHAEVVRTDGGSTFLAAMFHRDHRAHVMVCDLFTGCDEAIEWSALPLIQNGGVTPGDLLPAMALVGATEEIIVGTRNSAGELRLFESPLSAPFSWTPRVPGASIGTRGIAMDVDGRAVSTLYVTPPASEDLRVFTYDAQLNTFGPLQRVAEDVSLENDLMRVALGGAVQAVATVENGQLTAYYCPKTIGLCDNEVDWARVRIAEMPGNDGLGVDIVADGQSINIAALTGRQVVMSWCNSQDCGLKANWYTGASFRDQRLRATSANSRFFSKAASGRLGVGVARDDPGLGRVLYLYGGSNQGPYIVP